MSKIGGRAGLQRMSVGDIVRYAHHEWDIFAIEEHGWHTQTNERANCTSLKWCRSTESRASLDGGVLFPPPSFQICNTCEPACTTQMNTKTVEKVRHIKRGM